MDPMRECPIPNKDIGHNVQPLRLQFEEEEFQSEFGLDWEPWIKNDSLGDIKKAVDSWWGTLSVGHKLHHCWEYRELMKERINTLNIELNALENHIYVLEDEPEERRSL